MTKTVKEDPATALQNAAKEFSDQQKLFPFLDRIIAKEAVRNQASDDIRDIWNEIRQAGFDIPEARAMLVRRACSAR